MNSERITLSYGSGGRLMAELIKNVFLKNFQNNILAKLEDAAKLDIGLNQIAFTTDSYTVKPLFFPGGDIGKLAVCGTANDLAVMGARPLAISVSFIIEDGFLVSELKKIVVSLAKTAKQNNIKIVTGDIKVVGKSEADGLFINTSGIGLVHKGMDISCANVKASDAVIISGTIAEHGLCILNSRQDLGLNPSIQSDVACVFPLVRACFGFSRYIHAMRDPTRGGLLNVLNEIAQASGVGIKIFEGNIPLKRSVKNACQILGLDPLSIANEGKVVLFVDDRKSQDILKQLRKTKQGKNACIIGQAVKEKSVFLQTRLGSKRLLPLLEGESLPRIC